MPEVTARHALPNLFVSQAQKEVTHNEALARIDALLHPVVQDNLTAPPTALVEADDGKCWLIAAPAIGIWSGKERQIARWSGGSWRYLLPVDGMAIWHAIDQVRFFYIDGDWVSSSAIANPSGGATVDIEARAAIVAILDHLRQISSIAS
jgi:Protein of unknown function (DUF2793)